MLFIFFLNLFAKNLTKQLKQLKFCKFYIFLNGVCKFRNFEIKCYLFLVVTTEGYRPKRKKLIKFPTKNVQLVVSVKSWVDQLNLAVGYFDLAGYEKAPNQISPLLGWQTDRPRGKTFTRTHKHHLQCAPVCGRIGNNHKRTHHSSWWCVRGKDTLIKAIQFSYTFPLRRVSYRTATGAVFFSRLCVSMPPQW